MYVIKKMIIGMGAGLISGFFGAGGGMILVPAFTYFLNMDEKSSRATSVFSILPMVVTTGLVYMRQDFIDWNIGIKCAIGGAIGGYLGAKLLKKLSNNVLKILFTIFLSYVSIKMIFF